MPKFEPILLFVPIFVILPTDPIKIGYLINKNRCVNMKIIERYWMKFFFLVYMKDVQISAYKKRNLSPKKQRETCKSFLLNILDIIMCTKLLKEN